MYLAIEMVEDLPLDGGDATKADKPEPRVENSVGNDWVEVPPLLRKRKLNGRPKYKLKGYCLPPGSDLTSNPKERKYRVGLRRLRKRRKTETQPSSADVNGLVNA